MLTKAKANPWIAPEHESPYRSSLSGMEDLSVFYDDDDDGYHHIDSLYVNKDGEYEASSEYLDTENYRAQLPESLGICPLLGHQKVFWEEWEYQGYDGKTQRSWIKHDFQDADIFDRSIKRENESRNFEKLDGVLPETGVLVKDNKRWIVTDDVMELPDFWSEPYGWHNEPEVDGSKLVTHDWDDVLVDSQQAALAYAKKRRLDVVDEEIKEQKEKERTWTRINERRDKNLGRILKYYGRKGVSLITHDPLSNKGSWLGIGDVKTYSGLIDESED